MRFSQSHASVNEERVVDLTRRFGHGEGSGVRQVVVRADDEGVEGVTGIQVRILDELAADLGRAVDQMALVRLFLRLIDLFDGDKINLTLDAGQFFDGDLCLLYTSPSPRD